MNKPIHSHDAAQRALRVLHVLGSAEPPEGMEARIIGRLRERRTERTLAAGPSRSGSWLSPWRLAAFGTMVAGCVLLFMLTRTQTASPAPMVARLETPAPPPITASLPDPPLRNLAVRSTHHLTVSHSRSASPALRASLSFPAPHTPLTHQEELLLSLTRLPEQQIVALTAFLASPKPLPQPEQAPDFPSNKN